MISISQGFSLALAAVSQLSPNCSSALTGLVQSSGPSSCLQLGTLTTMFTGNGSASMVENADAYIDSVCTAAPCSPDTLVKILYDVTTGCSEELGLVGYNATDEKSGGQAIVATLMLYPTLRSMLCLKQDDMYCTTKDTQALMGAMPSNPSLSNILNPFGGVEIPSQLFCNDCSKESYNIFTQELEFFLEYTQVGPAIKSIVQKQCGDAFVDGKPVPGVVPGGKSLLKDFGVETSDGMIYVDVDAEGEEEEA